MIIYVDVDDTICEGDSYETAAPIRDNIDKINELYMEGHEVIYWTARGTLMEGNWFHVTYEQLLDWGCLFHELRMNKPVFDLFIDDKVMNSEHYFGMGEK
tara:strand:- start:2610 stop:2909 length:300 start_codon:yes stop_codon:yes gene_type:complete